jgi:hypothetical protein
VELDAAELPWELDDDEDDDDKDADADPGEDRRGDLG